MFQNRAWLTKAFSHIAVFACKQSVQTSAGDTRTQEQQQIETCILYCLSVSCAFVEYSIQTVVHILVIRLLLYVTLTVWMSNVDDLDKQICIYSYIVGF